MRQYILHLKSILRLRFYVLTLLFSGLFVLFSSIFATWRIISNTFIVVPQMQAKLLAIFQILTSHWMPHDPLGFTLFWIMTLFTGINLALVMEVILELEHIGKTTWSVSGIGLVALVSSGCSSCGFSALALLGSSAGVSFFVTNNYLILSISALLLIFTAAYNIHKLHKGLACKIG